MPASENRADGHELDVRLVPPQERHRLVLRRFEELSPGESLLVVNDHEPVHLVSFMKHERRDFDHSAYRAYERRPGEWVGVFKKGAFAPAQSGVVITSFEKMRQYDEASFSPVPVYSTSTYRVLLTYFKAGQYIPVHSPKIDLVFVVQSGRGTVVAGDERRKISPGDIMIVPRGVRRGIIAEADMEALHLVTPPPGDGDHDEVSKKLAEGSFE